MLRWKGFTKLETQRGHICLHMDVSENSGTSKSFVLIGFSIYYKYHPFWGVSLFLETPIYKLRQGFNSRNTGDKLISPFNRKSGYHEYVSPCYWVDDLPLLYGNNGSLDPNNYIYANIRMYMAGPPSKIETYRSGWGVALTIYTYVMYIMYIHIYSTQYERGLKILVGCLI